LFERIPEEEEIDLKVAKRLLFQLFDSQKEVSLQVVLEHGHLVP